MNNLEKLNNLQITIGSLKSNYERRKKLLSRFEDEDGDIFTEYENNYKNNMEKLQTDYFKTLYSHIVNTYIPVFLENSEELTVYNPSETPQKNTYVPIPEPIPAPTPVSIPLTEEETSKTEIKETTQNTLNKLDELKKELNCEKPSFLKHVQNQLPKTPQEFFYKGFLFTFNKILISLGLPTTNIISPFLTDPTKNFVYGFSLFGLWYFKPAFFYVGAGISYFTFQNYSKKQKDVEEVKPQIEKDVVKTTSEGKDIVESPTFFDFVEITTSIIWKGLKKIQDFLS